MTHLTFIAGGSKGLGESLVSIFQDNNHTVYEFSRTGHNPNNIQCDFTDVNAIQQIFDQAFSHQLSDEIESVNLIINTAILPPFGSLAATNRNVIHKHLTINIESIVLLLQSFVKAFQDSKIPKSIAYISSGAARRAIPGLALYSASKAFFERLVDTMSVEQNDQKNPIKCLTINPGVMNTGMQSEIRAQSKEDFPMVDMWSELYQTGQLANPKDVARVCFQLITDNGKNGGYYTAQELFKK